MKLINIGFGNMVSANRLIAIVSPESAPIKRIVQEARDKGSLIDATYGRRTRAVIIMDSDHVILSAVQPETVANRLNDSDDVEDEMEDELDNEDGMHTDRDFQAFRLRQGYGGQAADGAAPGDRGFLFRHHLPHALRR